MQLVVNEEDLYLIRHGKLGQQNLPEATTSTRAEWHARFQLRTRKIRNPNGLALQNLHQFRHDIRIFCCHIF